MIIDLPLIVVIKNGVVDEIKQATSDNCESLFLDTLKENISNYEAYSGSDIAMVLDNGYEHFGGTKNSVCLHHVEIDPALLFKS